jgi:phosphoglycolate phosphatase
VLLVLWDIDGTLVDAAGHGRDAFDDAFEAVFGRPPGLEIEMAGRTDHQIALAMLERGGVDDRDAQLPHMLDVLVAALAAQRDRMAAEGHAHAGAHDALAALAAREGVVQSLLTGNLELNAAVKLGAFGLDGLVDLEVGGYGSDPHVERSDLVAIARERAARKYGDATATVLVGDTPLDVRAAHRAGARAVAVATGPYDVGELAAAGADAVFEDLRDTGAVLAAVSER